MDGRTTLEEVEANLFGGVRGRRLSGHHPCVMVQHLSAADDSVDSARPNRLGDLAGGRRSRFVPSLTDLSCLP